MGMNGDVFHVSEGPRLLDTVLDSYGIKVRG